MQTDTTARGPLTLADLLRVAEDRALEEGRTALAALLRSERIWLLHPEWLEDPTHWGRLAATRNVSEREPMVCEHVFVDGVCTRCGWFRWLPTTG